MSAFVHVDFENLLLRLRSEGVSEPDIMRIRAVIEDARARANRPSAPDSAAVTAPGTPTAIRRSTSSQQIKAIVVKDPDDVDAMADAVLDDLLKHPRR